MNALENDRYNKILEALTACAPDGNLDLLEDEDGGAGRLVRRLVMAVVEEAKDRDGEPGPVLERLEAQRPAALFWAEIRERVEDRLQPYREMDFLRRMDADAQEKYLRETFENMVRYQEPFRWLTEQLGATDAQLTATLKTYNTLAKWMIQRRMSRRYFLERCGSFFGFDGPLAAFLWEMLDGERPMLAERAVFREIESLRQSFSETVEAFLEGLADLGDSQEEEEAD